MVRRFPEKKEPKIGFLTVGARQCDTMLCPYHWDNLCHKSPYEWKVRQHGVDKRRTWRKLHVSVNEKTGEILSAVVSTNDVSDDEVKHFPEVNESRATVGVGVGMSG